jgi:hypothetical protein
VGYYSSPSHKCSFDGLAGEERRTRSDRRTCAVGTPTPVETKNSPTDSTSLSSSARKSARPGTSRPPTTCMSSSNGKRGALDGAIAHSALGSCAVLGQGREVRISDDQRAGRDDTEKPAVRKARASAAIADHLETKGLRATFQPLVAVESVNKDLVVPDGPLSQNGTDVDHACAL